MEVRKDRRIAIVGLDAVGKFVHKILLSRYNLPTLSYLISNSIANGFMHCFPPVTVPSWQVIFSGSSLKNIGLTDFFVVEQKKGNLLIRIANSYDVKVPYHWEIGPKVKNGVHLVIGAPLSFPPRIKREDLIIVGDWLYPSEALYNKTALKVKPLLFNSIENLNDKDKYIHIVSEELMYIYDLIETILKRFNAVYLYMVLPYIDQLMHSWPKSLLKGELRDVLSSIDNLIKLIFDNFDTIIITSDHDFRPFNIILNIKYILIKKGLLSISSSFFNDLYLNYKLPNLFYTEAIWHLLLKTYKLKPKTHLDVVRPISQVYSRNSIVIPNKYPYLLKVLNDKKEYTNIMASLINVLRNEYQYLFEKNILSINIINNEVAIKPNVENIGILPGFIPFKRSIVYLKRQVYDHGVYGFYALYAKEMISHYRSVSNDIISNVDIGLFLRNLVGFEKKYLLAWRAKKILRKPPF